MQLDDQLYVLTKQLIYVKKLHIACVESFLGDLK